MFKNAIVLTGGIATGKSSVCNFLRLYGFEIIDADSVAHESLDENIQAIGEIFGLEYIKNSKVDRKKLGKLIFSDESSREKLENFIHPIIKAKIKKRSEAFENKNIPYIIDIPLFFEKKNYDIKEIILVYAPKEQQIKRLMSREGYNKEESNERINAQMPIDDKKSLASFVIDNSKDLKHMQKEVERFLSYIKIKYPTLKI
jgi:dephospho-CoA kinase